MLRWIATHFFILQGAELVKSGNLRFGPRKADRNRYVIPCDCLSSFPQSLLVPSPDTHRSRGMNYRTLPLVACRRLRWRV